MNYTRKYRHLSISDRRTIENFYFNENYNMSKIAKILNVNKSTISRELKRNGNFSGHYDSEITQIKANQRVFNKYSFRFLSINETTFSKLFNKRYDKKFYGVEATYHFIKSNFSLKFMPSLRTLFNWIRTNNWIVKRSNRLRQYYKKGGKRQKGVSRLLKNMPEYILPIWARPNYVDNRSEIGHWEGDLIIGKRANGFANLVTLTERVSRVTYSMKVSSKDPFKVNAIFKKIIVENNLLVKSITIDNGVEFGKIALLAKWLNIVIYIANPYASFERATNEHSNGLIRREYPKGTDFSSISDHEICQTISKINNMPRKIFGWRSANDIYNQKIREYLTF